MPSNSQTTTHRRRGIRVVAVTLAAMAALSLLAVPPAAAQQTFPWGTGKAGEATAPGAEHGTLIVGDSLLVNMGLHTMANDLSNVTGRSTYANAAAGALWVTYGWPGQQNNNALIWNYANLMTPRITVAALATNDARIIHQHPAYYDQQKQYNVMHNAVSQTRQHSPCVLLVNVRARNIWPGMSAGAAQTVNNNMLWLASGGYSGGGVYLADWNSHAAGNDSTWFQFNDVHLTQLGEDNYRAFITASTQHLINNHGC